MKSTRDELGEPRPLALADVQQTRPLLAELRSYSSPPGPVHRTMEAVFILLGEERRKYKDWKFVLWLLNGYGGWRQIGGGEDRILQEACW